VNRPALGLVALILFIGTASAQTPDTPLTQALIADPVQASYLARHPEILRWVAKHPEQALKVAGGRASADERAKNNGINEWVAAWPNWAALVAAEAELSLSWADDPRSLSELGKRGRK
jgi:hypothetical protein